MKVFTETKTIEKTCYKYVSSDNQVFSNEKECSRHEDEIKLKNYIEKYNINDMPSFIEGISDDARYCYLLRFTGKKEDFIDCLSFLQFYYIRNNEIEYEQNLTNVRKADLSLESLKDFDFKEGTVYLFTVYWHEYCDDYDTYYWKLWDAEQAFDQINKTIKKIEKVFDVKYPGNSK